jgi:hypothetical protein
VSRTFLGLLFHIVSFWVTNQILQTFVFVLDSGWFGLLVFNATFNNILVTSILWRSFLLVEEIGVSRENQIK